MCCADSSEWRLFGHNTRSAFRRTPSRKMQPILQLGDLLYFECTSRKTRVPPRKYSRIMQPILQRRSHFFWKNGYALWICHSLFTLISKLLSWMWMAYSIDKSIIFQKKCSLFLRMCIFCCTFAAVLEKTVNVTSFGCKIMRGHNRLTN